MIRDSITEEIRAIRHELAARCGNDIRKILEVARQGEASDGRKYLTLSKRPSRVDVKEDAAETPAAENALVDG